MLGWQGTLIDTKRDGSGLDFKRNRVTDPTTGRFTQEDSGGLRGGMNLYGYAGGDPVNFGDPFGDTVRVRGSEPKRTIQQALDDDVTFRRGGATGGPGWWTR